MYLFRHLILQLHFVLKKTVLCDTVKELFWMKAWNFRFDVVSQIVSSKPDRLDLNLNIGTSHLCFCLDILVLKKGLLALSGFIFTDTSLESSSQDKASDIYLIKDLPLKAQDNHWCLTRTHQTVVLGWLFSFLSVLQYLKLSKVYLRSELLHEVKHLVDVLRVFLPHEVGLVTTHVCRRFSRALFFGNQGERKDFRGGGNTTKVPQRLAVIQV